MFLANWDVGVTCTIQDEDGPDFDQLFLPSRFQAEQASVSDGTDQSTSMVIAGYDGQIYGELMSMTFDQRAADPIIVRPRMYWSDSQNKQLINPSPKWTVHSIVATFDAVRGDLQAAPMRVQRIGSYYTALEFPVLNFAR